jgi:hypothetical protein
MAEYFQMLSLIARRSGTILIVPKNDIVTAIVLFIFFVGPSCCPSIAQQRDEDKHSSSDQTQSSADRDALQKQISDLVAELGNDSFSVRENAAQQLLEIGLPCVDQLQQYRNAPDSEVRFAATRIVKKIVRDDFQNRLSALLSAPEGDTNDFGLPGWKLFSKEFGGSKNSRQLFVEIQKLHPKLMASLESDIDDVNSELKKLMAALAFSSRRYGDTPLASFVACIFVATLDEIDGKEIELPINADANLASFFQNQLVVSELREGKNKDVLMKILVQWIAMDVPDSSQDYSRINIATEHNLKAAVPIALELLKNRNTHQTYLAKAIWYLAQVDGKNQVSEIEALLGNETLITESIQRIDDKDVRLTVQVRDVALAALVYLYKESYREFGFEFATDNFSGQLELHKAGFRDEQSRKKAMEKWETLKKENN